MAKAYDNIPDIELRLNIDLYTKSEALRRDIYLRAFDNQGADAHKTIGKRSVSLPTRFVSCFQDRSLINCIRWKNKNRKRGSTNENQMQNFTYHVNSVIRFIRFMDRTRQIYRF